MKRIILLALAVVLLFSCATAGAESGRSNFKQLYRDMETYFEEGDLTTAWFLTQAIYEAAPDYRDISRYYIYLRARMELLPSGDYKKAYDYFIVLVGSTRSFKDAEGYADFARGLQYLSERNAGQARKYLLKAADEGVNEAYRYLIDIPGSQTAPLTLTAADADSLTVSWEDPRRTGSYKVTYAPLGIAELALEAQTSELSITLTGLIPDTLYSVSVEGGSLKNEVLGMFSTLAGITADYDKAHSVRVEMYQTERADGGGGAAQSDGPLNGHATALSAGGYTLIGRRPGDDGNDFYATVSFAASSALEDETESRFTYVLRSTSMPLIRVGRTETVAMERGKKTQSIRSGRLTDLMGLLYDYGCLGEASVTLEVYIDGRFIGSQEILINQR
ncbi:MAG: fibronectin type III domain-containing protein [Clostridia bacterium]|nr:fibronectin type III domain-containing protein [Clostridia bacterium]